VKLSELKKGQLAKIVSLNLDDVTNRRLISLGFCKGNLIEFERSAPLKDPSEYYVAGNFIALRKVDADRIEVEIE
jgi:Fe2+ transport system protein FeoA